MLFLALIGILVAILLFVFQVYFLIKVPQYLEDISVSFRVLTSLLIENNVAVLSKCGKLDPAIAKKVESQVQSDFENSSTLQ